MNECMDSLNSLVGAGVAGPRRRVALYQVLPLRGRHGARCLLGIQCFKVLWPCSSCTQIRLGHVALFSDRRSARSGGAPIGPRGNRPAVATADLRPTACTQRSTASRHFDRPIGPNMSECCELCVCQKEPGTFGALIAVNTVTAIILVAAGGERCLSESPSATPASSFFDANFWRMSLRRWVQNDMMDAHVACGLSSAALIVSDA